MKIRSKNWKVFKSGVEEYILFSSDNATRKISGTHASAIVDILKRIQDGIDTEEGHSSLAADQSSIKYMIEWLNFNNFIEVGCEKTARPTIVDVIGEFSGQTEHIEDLIDSLPNDIGLGKVYDLSRENNRFFFDKNHFYLLIGPFWFDEKKIEKISHAMQKVDADFLYIEVFENSISIGPLLNTKKGTACLNCINIRKLLNKPEILVQNLRNMKAALNSVNVLASKNFNICKAFIYNELYKILILGNKQLYNKAVLIDLLKYENQFFDVIRAPNCTVCNDKEVVNPL